MNIFLTGGTGYIGSEVMKQLLSGGHSVTALVRSQESAQKVEAAGATAIAGNIEATTELAEIVAPFDAVIHLASPSDETSVIVDRSIATAVTKAFADTGKTYIHTGGAWVYGDSDSITEDLPFNPPAITSWRTDIENIALGGSGMRTSVIEPGIVYGNGGGLLNVMVHSPRTSTGAVQMIGDGAQHWIAVHVADVADLYLRALTDGKQGYYLAASGQNPTVREVAEAISRAGGNGDVVEGTADQAAEALGPLAEALLMDQQAQGTKAKTELGWKPSGPSIIDEIETGSYSPKS